MVVLFLILKQVSQRSFNNVHRLFVDSQLKNCFLWYVSPTVTCPVQRLLFLPPDSLLKRTIKGYFSGCLLLSSHAQTRLYRQVRARNRVGGLFVRRQRSSFCTPYTGTFIHTRTVVWVRFTWFARNLFVRDLYIQNLVRVWVSPRCLIHALTT